MGAMQDGRLPAPQSNDPYDPERNNSRLHGLKSTFASLIPTLISSPQNTVQMASRTAFGALLRARAAARTRAVPSSFAARRRGYATQQSEHSVRRATSEGWG